MHQETLELNCSRTSLALDSTMVVAVEMSLSTWLVCAEVPGLDEPLGPWSIQVPVALDRADPDFPLCRDGEDFHAVEYGTSDPGQLAEDQDIIGPEPIQYSRDLSVAPGRFAGCR